MAQALIDYGRYLLFDFTRHLSLLLVLAVLGALIFARLGRSYGVHLLFWHERRLPQFAAGVSSALLFATVGFVGYLLDEDQLRGLSVFSVLPAGPTALRIMLYIVLLSVPTWLGWLVLSVISPLSPSAVKPPFRMPFVIGAFLGLSASFVMLYYLTQLSYPRWFVQLLLLGRGLPRDQLSASEPLHATVAVLVLALCAECGVYLVLKRGFTPAIAICTLLGLLAGGAGFMEFQQVNPTLLVLVGVALLAIGGAQRYKLRLAALSDRYRSPVRLQRDGPLAPNERATRKPLSDTIPQWALAEDELPLVPRGNGPRKVRLRRLNQPALIKTDRIPWRRGEGPRPLVLICASGGGLRAALWTAHVLSELELAIPGFSTSIRLIAGASGGMVGASMYALTLAPNRSKKEAWGHTMSREALVARLGQDSLSSPVARLLFHDLLLSLLPLKNVRNRGEALDASFRRNFGTPFELSFGDIVERERTGELPSLVFTPTLVEDGRRLLISNLDCSFILRNDMLVNGDQQLLSHSGRELARLFPDEFRRFPIRTAARLSAAFPYVSPAVSLPTVPRRRVVDAGYYDNYGVNVCAAWLADCFSDPRRRRWIEQNVSRVLVVQIRDAVSPLSGLQPPVDPKHNIFERGFEELLSPLHAARSARDSVSVFRNDEQLEQILRLYNDCDNDSARSFDPAFVRTDIFAYSGGASLSWYLSGPEQDDIRDAAHALKDELQGIRDWWHGATDRKSSPLGIHIARTKFVR